MRTAIGPALAGVAASLTGFCGSVAVLLAGLSAAGATRDQAASGLLVLCLAQGVLSLTLTLRLRIPAMFAWSTPGAALLVAAGHERGTFATAVGAFLVAGLLVALIGAVPALARGVERIPGGIAGGLLAGVLLPFCLAPATAAVATPLTALPLIAGWLLLQRFAPRVAGPIAIVAAVVVVVLTTGGARIGPPVLALTPPAFDPLVVLGLGVPLALVTMAGQNLPGLAVLRVNGFSTPTRLLVTAGGVGSALVAPFGGVATNLAAITAALVVGDDGGPRDRRWIGGVAYGVSSLALAPLTGVAIGLIGTDPPQLVRAAAGLALLGAFAGGLTTALARAEHRLPAIVTFLVVASGIAVAGIGSAFWGLVAGLAALLLLRPRSAA